MSNIKKHQKKTIFICAGEASGDLLGAKLAASLLEKNPELQLIGIGGEHMRKAKVDIKLDAGQLAVVGVLEIIKKLKPIRQAYSIIKNIIINNPPDLFILIDYPGFNLRLAKIAKQANIKVMYYVSPQIWAWRSHRIHHIKKYVDHMAVLFPFEERLYQKADIPVTFVGHPLAETKKPILPVEEILQRLGLEQKLPVIALCPGSRLQEIKRMLPLLTNCMETLRRSIPNAQFVIPLAKNLSPSDLTPYINQDIKIVSDLNQLLAVSSAAIAVSGTVTLEIALADVPLVIFYKMSPISAFIARRVVKTPFFGLCNVIAEKEMAKEYFQQEATPENIAKESLKLIQNSKYRQSILEDLKTLPAKLAAKNAAQKAANVALDLLQQ